MATSDALPSPTAPRSRPSRRSSTATGVGLLLGTGLANQSGAATASLAFPVLGPVGVVALRQCTAGLVLLVAGRPGLRALTGAQWRTVLGSAAVFGGMNLSLYAAVERIGLGLAVTLEFLGPLAVALASSRRRLDAGCAVAAAAAVLVLTRPQPSSDHLGIGLALLAACCWAGHILFSRELGRRVPGTQGSIAAAAVSALVCLPVAVLVLALQRPSISVLACALAAGVLSSAVPLLADLLALRRVPAGLFGVFMSVNPVYAAVIGTLFLGERLDGPGWAAIAVIVTANAATAVATHRREAAGPADPVGRRAANHAPR
ncbi:EamA family transporter [Saccharopolyspora sp. HNM0983]|uniref:EamA family transporter n=1 Tax=Saccharopolyspora montiporae TaxID=2781240 RepID=A0A929FYM6_9PSEU|nr:EamA family transporter [Saccharopolyspora sp. HNM0983]MBE9373640.1 EamA family transporter [Saccharopolyspora sp. HNM0983]